MRDDSTMVAIEAALRSTDACLCGRPLDITARDGGLWLECRTFASPFLLPAGLARGLRTIMHSRAFVAPERATVEPLPTRELPGLTAARTPRCC